MSAQLALDALPEWRTRDGIWPVEAHQRGFVRLPYTVVGGAAGELVEAWVCCRCGGVQLNAHLLCNNHGCCYTPWYAPCRQPPRLCAHLDALERDRRSTRPIVPQYGPFDLCWLPERPP
jgi:hypothetical protein